MFLVLGIRKSLDLAPILCFDQSYTFLYWTTTIILHVAWCFSATSQVCIVCVQGIYESTLH